MLFKGILYIGLLAVSPVVAFNYYSHTIFSKPVVTSTYKMVTNAGGCDVSIPSPTSSLEMILARRVSWPITSQRKRTRPGGLLQLHRHRKRHMMLPCHTRPIKI